MFAQHVVYIMFFISLYHSLCKCLFINTFPPFKQTFVLKSNKQLQNLLHESKDIKSLLIIDKYMNYPSSYINLSLYEFSTYYYFAKKKKNIIHFKLLVLFIIINIKTHKIIIENNFCSFIHL